MYPNQPNRKLACQIAGLLDVSPRSGTKVLRAILGAIATGLRRDGRVYIRGFGTFKLVSRIHRPTPNNILTNDKGEPIYAAGLQSYQPRRVLIFEPSLPLMGMLNMSTPNYKERRTQRSWKPCL